jgi:hypothetical protein
MILRLSILVCALTFTLSADEWLTNGGFESGISGWMVTGADQYDGWFVTDAPAAPLSGNPTVGPNSGTKYAVSDSFNPGTRTLTQSFTDTGAGQVVLSGSMFVNDWIGGGAGFAQVDILAGGADPITGTPIAIAYGPVDTAVAGGFGNSYVAFTEDLTAFLTPGNTYLLRILESDSAPLNVGVDDLSITFTPTAVPEPSSVFLLMGVVGFVAYRARGRLKAKAV